MSGCLDRKEVRGAIWGVHSTGTGQPVETQDVFFWYLAGRSAATGLAIVHWIECINAIKRNFHWVLPWGPKCNKVCRYSNLDIETLDELTVLQALHAQTNWAVVENKCCCKSKGVNCSTKCHVGSDCCQNLIG